MPETGKTIPLRLIQPLHDRILEQPGIVRQQRIRILTVHHLGKDGAAIGHGFQLSQGIIGLDPGLFRHVTCLLQLEFQQGRQLDLIRMEKDFEYLQEFLAPGCADGMRIEFFLKLVIVMHGPPPVYVVSMFFPAARGERDCMTDMPVDGVLNFFKMPPRIFLKASTSAGE